MTSPWWKSSFPIRNFRSSGAGACSFARRKIAASLLLAVREVMHSLDPELPLYDVRSLADLVDENVAARRLSVILLSVFAVIALLLASLGVYGVMAYMVTGRTREIALRLVLGAKAVGHCRGWCSARGCWWCWSAQSRAFWRRSP